MAKSSALHRKGTERPELSRKDMPASPNPSIDQPIAEREEITGVTPRSKLITVKIGSPKRRPAPIRRVVPQPSDNVPISLTLLGARNAPPIVTNDTLFAGISMSPAFSVRATVIGAGLMAAAALFLFGNGGAWKFVSTLASNDSSASRSIASDTAPAEQITPAPRPPAASRKPLKVSDVPAVKSSDIQLQSPKLPAVKAKPLTVKNVDRAAETVSKTTAKASARSEPKDQRTTLRPTTKEIIRKLDGSTRPRIVKIPG
jgi:hypothetical protein